MTWTRSMTSTGSASVFQFVISFGRLGGGEGGRKGAGKGNEHLTILF